MRKKIDGFEWVHIADLTKSSQGFDQAITVTFTSEAGLETYNTHSDHMRIQELAQGIVEDFATYEYWEKIE